MFQRAFEETVTLLRLRSLFVSKNGVSFSPRRSTREVRLIGYFWVGSRDVRFYGTQGNKHFRKIGRGKPLSNSSANAGLPDESNKILANEVNVVL